MLKMNTRKEFEEWSKRDQNHEDGPQYKSWAVKKKEAEMSR